MSRRYSECMRIGHARRIGVPRHQVDWVLAFAEKIGLDDPRPDEVVRAQHLESARHLRAVEIALLPHHVVEQRELTFVREELQLAGFREIGLRGEQGQAGEPLIARRAPWRRRRWRAACRQGSSRTHGPYGRRKSR